MKVCAEPGCPALTGSTYCPTHKPKPWATSDRRSRLPRDWERRRKRILKRDPYCQDGRLCLGANPSTQVDHRIPNDDHSDANLQGICAPCHRAKTQEEAQVGKRASQS